MIGRRHVAGNRKSVGASKRQGILGRFERFLGRFIGEDNGALCVEMAVATPIFVTVLLGGVDAARYVVLSQKSERAAATIADLVSQAETLKESEVSDVFNIASYVMEPFEANGRMKIVLTSINNKTGTATIAWQRAWGGGSGGSVIGAEGGNANLPEPLVVRSGEAAIAAEVFYAYVPMFLPETFSSTTLYRWSVFRPRFSNLDTLNAG